MHNFKKNLQSFPIANSVVRLILKPWVWIYSLELEEFENIFIVFVL